MTTTQYRFREAVSAFYEMPTDAARSLLAGAAEPMEVRHGSAILALTAFDFTHSMAGSYHEIVLAVIVPPRMKPGGEVPRSAFYPFLVGTSTPESRRHAIERWHLPHYMEDIQLAFEYGPRRVEARVTEGARPVLDFSVFEHEWSGVNHLYQCFMKDGPARFKVDIHMEGRFCEHEEESGRLVIHDHPMCAGLDPRDISDRPFRELWMKEGQQTFEALETL